MPVYRCMDKEGAVHIYEGILAIKKEQNNVICSNMEELRDYHAKRSKSDKDTFHMTSLICGNYFLKNDISDLIYKTQNRLTGFKNKLTVTKGDKLRAWH